MRGRRHSLLRLLALLGALACAAALMLLLEIRPPLPPLPRSLSSPITLALVRGSLEVAAWGVSVALAALLLVHSLRVVLSRSPRQPPRALRRGAAPTPRRRSIGQARVAAGAAEGGFPPPFPLVLRTRTDLEHTPPPSRERVLAATAQGVQIAEPAPVRTAPAPPMEELSPPSIALLGPIKIAPWKRGPRGLRSQTQQLLAYLALHAEGATTDELVALLWPDLDDKKARKRLWRSVSEARAHLGQIILRADERYLLDREAITVDLDRFEELIAKADAERGIDRQHLLERALAPVRGQPLAGTDYAWAAGDIRRLRAMVVDRLEELGYLRLEDGNPTGALAVAEQAIALDANNEAAHRLGMHAESVLGLRQAIVDRYEQLSRELDERFGLEPEHETRVLYRRLLSQDPEEQ